MRMFGISALTLAIVILGGCNAEGEAQSVSPSPSMKPDLNVSDTQKSVVLSKSSPAERPFDWKTAEVNEENVRKALSENVGAAMAIPVTDKTFRRFVSSSDAKGEYVEVTVNPGLFADYKDFVKRSGGSLIAYSKILFSNPAVYEVSVNTKIDNVEGKENDGVYISWRREDASGVDYDKVLDNLFGDYTIPYGLARKYIVQKEIFEGLKEFTFPQERNL